MAIMSDVLKYFEDHPGSTVYVNDLADLLNIEHSQARVAVNNIRNRNEEFKARFTTIVRGNAWRYNPNPPEPEKKKKNHMVFEEVGKTKDGSIVLECEDGTLYKAVEL